MTKRLLFEVTAQPSTTNILLDSTEVSISIEALQCDGPFLFAHLVLIVTVWKSITKFHHCMHHAITVNSDLDPFRYGMYFYCYWQQFNGRINLTVNMPH